MKKMCFKLVTLLRFLTRPKILTRITSFVLAVVLLFLIPPSVVYAELGEALNQIGSATRDSDNDGEKNDERNGEIYEITELREESAKHFKLPDGSYIAAQYEYPVHYEDESGVYRDIDNALYPSGSEYSNSNARIKFAKKINGSQALFTLQDGNTKLTFSLIGANKGVKGEVTNYSENDGDTELQKKINLEVLNAEILYKNILDGVDLQYVAHSLNVKENIIVKEKKDSYSYSFELKLNNLSATLQEIGDITISDEAGALVYTIPAPVVFDSAECYASGDKSAYTLTDQGNGKYILTVNVDADWMNGKERVFPVTIDPAITVPNSTVQDTSISSAAPDDALGDQTTLPINSVRHAYWKTTSLPTIPASATITSGKIKLRSTLTDGDYIGAYEVLTDWDEGLTWNQYQNTTNPKGKLGDKIVDYVSIMSGFYTWDITELVKKWYAGQNYGVAFNHLPGMTATLQLYSSENASVGGRPVLTISYLDMRGLEDYWSYSSHSAGLGGTGYVNLYSGNLVLALSTLSTTDSLMPYTPTLVYDSAMANKASTISNAQVANVVNCIPLGFKINMFESIVSYTRTNSSGTSETYYVHSDADGTEHYFYDTGITENDCAVYADDDGLQKRLLVSSTATGLVITDDSGIKRNFSKYKLGPSPDTNGGWSLKSIEDKSGNKMLFGFSASYKPSTVSIQSVGGSGTTILKLEYYSIGVLKRVYNSQTGEFITFRYSDTYNGTISNSYTKYLREVSYARYSASATNSNLDNFAISKNNTTNIDVYTTVTYEYDSSGRLTSITDPTQNQTISYTWTNGRVMGISHTAGSTAGQSISLTYGTGYTDVRGSGNDDITGTSDDVITRYVFDERGRSTSVYSYGAEGTEIYGAVYGVYETQENVKNNLKETATLGGSPVNYLLNGAFEKYTSRTNLDHWTEGGTVDVITSYDFNGGYEARLMPAAGSSSYIYQLVKLDAGVYTLTIPYRSFSAYGCSATVNITSQSGSGFSHTEEISLNPNLITGYENTFATTFEITAPTDTVTVKISFSVPSGTTNSLSLTLSSAMLTRGSGSMGYSMVYYGGFSPSSALNTTGSTVALSNYWTSSTGSLVTENAGGVFGTAAKVSAGGAGSVAYVKQRVYQADTNMLSRYGQTEASHRQYTVTGYAKASSARAYSESSFRIRIDVAYYQGENNVDVVRSYYYNFVPSATDWQFVSGNFNTVPDATADYSCVRYIDLYCEYNGQLSGYALFDNLAVSESTETDRRSHEYNSAGQIVAIRNVFYEEYYEYNSDRTTKRWANNKGEIIDYTYDSLKRLIREDYYTFTYGSTTKYPFGDSSPDSLITKTKKRSTAYTYNTYGLCTKVTTTAYSSGTALSAKLTSSYTYSTNERIFGALLSETDTNGITVYYFYDTKDGKLLATANTGSGNAVSYTYDARNRLIGATPATYVSGTTPTYTPETGSESVAYTYDSLSRLSTVVTGSTTYAFTYDVFGNASTVNAGSNTLAYYQYNESNGKLKKTAYSNGYMEHYYYNDLELLEKVCYTLYNGAEVTAYEYEYTADGYLYKFSDRLNGKITVYRYDSAGRFIGSVNYTEGEEYHESSTKAEYNAKGELWMLYRYISNPSDITKYIEWTNTYSYRSDGAISSVQTRFNDYKLTETYTYDSYDRVSARSLGYGHASGGSSVSINGSYTFADTSSGASSRITGHTVKINGTVTTTYTYTYDGEGNITSVTYGGKTVSYAYDNLGQLVRENNQHLGYTYVYTYDDAGNILKKSVYPYTAPSGTLPSTPSDVSSYAYKDAWGDQLTTYEGMSISYDRIGNPAIYYNGYNGTLYKFTWTGRRMTGATYSGSSYTFTYNDEGIRTSKTKDGVTTTYYLEGSLIMAEETNGNLTVYFYDSTGSPMGMRYLASGSDTWQLYLYDRNLQGDIVGVYNTSGTKLVSYTYDAWGNCAVSYVNGGGFTAAANNPFRYRGYYFDADLGLYYLNSRYYDSNTGRFISADEPGYLGANGDLVAYNLYAYCSNNPVMHTDPSGHAILTAILIGLVIGAAVGGTAGGVIAYNAAEDAGLEGDELFWATAKGVGVGAAVGGAAGGLVGLTGGAIATYGLGSAAATTTISGTGTILARAAEVGSLQYKKSYNDGKGGWQIAGDILNASLNNGLNISGVVPFTKVGGITAKHFIDKSFEKVFGSNLTFKQTLANTTSNKIIAYSFLTYSVTSTIISILSNDPISRAKERGYCLV